MKMYVPAPAAKPLSEALWGLSDPNPTRGTTSMFGYVDDMQNPPQRWLVVDTEFTIPVHEGAELGGIAAIYADHGLEQAEIDALAAYVVANQGKRICPWDVLFPAFFKDLSNDLPQMVAAGWLPNLSMP